MKQIILAIALAGIPALAGASDLKPIRSQFAADYDAAPQRIGMVLARQRAAIFEMGGRPEPLMDPAYGRRVPVDATLERALISSMANIVQALDAARFLDVRMMTSTDEALVVACGQVRERRAATPHPFLAMFTNPHAGTDLHAIGFTGAEWISASCDAMGLD